MSLRLPIFVSRSRVCRRVSATVIKIQFDRSDLPVHLFSSFSSRVTFQCPTVHCIQRSTIHRIQRTPVPSARRKISAGHAEKAGSSIYNLVAKGFKMIRIPALVFGIYELGKMQGVIEYLRDPEEFTNKILNKALEGINSRGINRDCEMHAKFERVGQRIVWAAKKVLAMNLIEARKTGDEEAEKHWINATESVQGPWTYILVESDDPNSFVTEILPRTIFVTSSFLEKVVENEDELALVIGQEVSNLIHDNHENHVSVVSKYIEVLILTLDPTEGLLSLLMVWIANILPRSMQMSVKKEKEREIEKAGIKVTAMACYNTRKGLELYRRMHKKGALEIEENSLRQFISTHSSTKERFESLWKESEIENLNKYPDSCLFIKHAFSKSVARVENSHLRENS